MTFFLNELLLRRAPSALEGGERLHLIRVGCENYDGLVNGPVALYDLMTWFID